MDQRRRPSGSVLASRPTAGLCFARLRPAHGREADAAEASAAVLASGTQVVVGSQTDASGRAFEVDRVLPTDQEGAWREVGDVLLRAVLAGCDATVLAVGPSGGGKGYTVGGTADEPGLAPRALRALCARCAEDASLRLELCMLEVHMDQVYDLLAPRREPRTPLKLRTGDHPPVWLPAADDSPPARRPSVAGASPPKPPPVADGGEGSWHAVGSYAQAEALRQFGEAQRTVRPTYLHQRTARAHTLFFVRLTKLSAAAAAEEIRHVGSGARQAGARSRSVVAAHAVDPLWSEATAGSPPAGAAAEGDGDDGDGDGDGDGHREEWQARLCFAQLAGLERLEAGGGQGLPPVALREALSIQSSTAALSAALQAAARRDHATPATKTAPAARPAHPLVQLMREALDGRALLVSVVALGPSEALSAEAISALRLGSLARQVTVDARPRRAAARLALSELSRRAAKLNWQAAASLQIASADGGGDTQQINAVRQVQEVQQLKRRLGALVAAEEGPWDAQLRATAARAVAVADAADAAGTAGGAHALLAAFGGTVAPEPPRGGALVDLLAAACGAPPARILIAAGATCVVGPLARGGAGAAEPGSPDAAGGGAEPAAARLWGLRVCARHVTLQTDASGAATTVLPGAPDALTFVNGELLEAPRVLQHGDRVVFGAERLFRFELQPPPLGASALLPAAAAGAGAAAFSRLDALRDALAAERELERETGLRLHELHRFRRARHALRSAWAKSAGSMAQLDGTPPPTRPSPPAAAPAPEAGAPPAAALAAAATAPAAAAALAAAAPAASSGGSPSATEAELRRQLAALSRRCEAAEAAVRSKEASLREHEGTRTALLDALDESRARLSEMAEELAEARHYLRAAEARSPRSSSPALASLLGCVGGREEKLGAGGGGASSRPPLALMPPPPAPVAPPPVHRSYEEERYRPASADDARPGRRPSVEGWAVPDGGGPRTGSPRRRRSVDADGGGWRSASMPTAPTADAARAPPARSPGARAAGHIAWGLPHEGDRAGWATTPPAGAHISEYYTAFGEL